MSTQLIVLISMILLVGWLLGNILYSYRIRKNKIYDSNFMFHVQCENCGAFYEVNPRQYDEARNKRKGKTNTKNADIKSQRKKFFCPNCYKKEYAKILNLADYHEKYGGVLIKTYVKQFIYINVGTLAILLLMVLLIWFFS